jgi:hypothetical protein
MFPGTPNDENRPFLLLDNNVLGEMAADGRYQLSSVPVQRTHHLSNPRASRSVGAPNPSTQTVQPSVHVACGQAEARHQPVPSRHRFLLRVFARSQVPNKPPVQPDAAR